MEWVNSLFKNRQDLGQASSLVPELMLNELHTLKSYLKADVSSFQLLLEKLEPRLTPRNHTPRAPIPAKHKIIVTLRFFATGQAFSDALFDFRMAKSTIHNLIYEVCIAIIEVLGPEYMATPTSPGRWNEIANGKFNFYHQLDNFN